MKRDRHGRFVPTGGRKRGKQKNPARLRTRTRSAKTKVRRDDKQCSFCGNVGLYPCAQCEKYLSCARHAYDTRRGRVCPVCAAEDQQHAHAPRVQRPASRGPYDVTPRGAVSARSLAMRGRYNPPDGCDVDVPMAPRENPYRRMARTNAGYGQPIPAAELERRRAGHQVPRVNPPGCGACTQGFCARCTRPSQRGCCCR